MVSVWEFVESTEGNAIDRIDWMGLLKAFVKSPILAVFVGLTAIVLGVWRAVVDLLTGGAEFLTSVVRGVVGANLPAFDRAVSQVTAFLYWNELVAFAVAVLVIGTAIWAVGIVLSRLGVL